MNGGRREIRVFQILVRGGLMNTMVGEAIDSLPDVHRSLKGARR
jgi:hypothetical protein